LGSFAHDLYSFCDNYSQMKEFPPNFYFIFILFLFYFYFVLFCFNCYFFIFYFLFFIFFLKLI